MQKNERKYYRLLRGNNMKICEKGRCTGCGACVSICPKGAIRLAYNRKQELVTIVDKEKCVNCGLCKKVCQVNNDFKNNGIICCYAAWIDNQKERERCASGGIGYTLVKNMLLNQGVSYAACLDESQEVSICRITDKDQINKIKGSKYVYSYTKNTYKQVKNDLKNGEKVLYIGLPCQVAGLYGYLGKEKCNNLYTVDIICHGSASHKLWEDHIKLLKEQNKLKEYDNFSFRSNIEGENYYLSFQKEDKTILNIWNEHDEYFFHFLNGTFLRDSCYHCKYKCEKRVGDITIGDFIGLGKEHKFDEDDGNTSVILVNNEKGKELLSQYSKDIKLIERNISEAVENGPSLNGNINKNYMKKIFGFIYIFLGYKHAVTIMKYFVKIRRKLKK